MAGLRNGLRAEPVDYDPFAGFDPGRYDTKLPAADEASFQQWKQQHAPRDSGEDYDLRGAFQSGFTPDAESGHFPDTYKKPNHPTFSDQSIYHGKGGNEGGSWSKQGQRWVFTPGRSNYEHNDPNELRDYFADVEPGNVLQDRLIPPPVDPRGTRGTGAGEFLGRLATTPGKAVQQGITTEEAIPWAADLAMTLGGVGSARAGVGLAKGQAGSFGGMLTPGADLKELNLALEMTRRGMRREQVFDATGWFQGVGGDWMYRIPDTASRFRHRPLREGTTVGDYLEHPELFKHDPSLEQIPLKFTKPPNSAHYQPGTPEHIALPTNRTMGDRSLLLHELNHALSNRLGRPKGGNLNQFRELAEKVITEQGLPPGMADRLAYESYQRLADETLARLVQAERDVPVNELKKIPPFNRYDVPESKQTILRGKERPTLLHVEPVDYDPFK